ncbi:hypothetical protein ACPV5O_25615 [Vibrio maritimus]|uniref:hypothetical protein n=1 Tax=Vibrio maritimus TaxID=990268 RepID=UPI004067A295
MKFTIFFCLLFGIFHNKTYAEEINVTFSQLYAGQDIEGELTLVSGGTGGIVWATADNLEQPGLLGKRFTTALPVNGQTGLWFSASNNWIHTLTDKYTGNKIDIKIYPLHNMIRTHIGAYYGSYLYASNCEYYANVGNWPRNVNQNADQPWSDTGTSPTHFERMFWYVRTSALKNNSSIECQRQTTTSYDYYNTIFTENGLLKNVTLKAVGYTLDSDQFVAGTYEGDVTFKTCIGKSCEMGLYGVKGVTDDIIIPFKVIIPEIVSIHAEDRHLNLVDKDKVFFLTGDAPSHLEASTRIRLTTGYHDNFMLSVHCQQINNNCSLTNDKGDNLEIELVFEPKGHHLFNTTVLSPQSPIAVEPKDDIQVKPMTHSINELTIRTANGESERVYRDNAGTSYKGNITLMVMAIVIQ